jgi:hypothetical protein
MVGINADEGIANTNSRELAQQHGSQEAKHK